jgi:hypothetical protein
VAKLLPLPATNTPRYKLLYSSLVGNHAIVVHQDPATTQSQAITNATALANALKPLLQSPNKFTGIQWAIQGSDVFNDVATLNITGTGAAGENQLDRPFCVTLTARAPTGRKTRVTLFGSARRSDANWRVTTTESTTVATLISAMNAGAGDVRTIDGQIPIWHSYVNVTAHKHYVRRVRQTG